MIEWLRDALPALEDATVAEVLSDEQRRATDALHRALWAAASDETALAGVAHALRAVEGLHPPGSFEVPVAATAILVHLARRALG